jgi:sensor histidine kinase YesM
MVISAIWQLIRLINRRLEKRFTIEERPGTQILVQVIVTVILLSPVFILSYLLIRPYLSGLISEKMLPIIVGIYLMLILLMIFGYYAYDLFLKYRIVSQEKTRLQLETTQLEKEKTMMQYHHLKNQVNPHFLFNTFSSLDSLIQTDPSIASEFVHHLSKVYRYVLEHKENEVVNLETELSFIQHYISLLKIRYKKAISVKLNVSEEARDKGIVMITLEMLIDNAIKHNVVHEASPLHISISDADNYLYVHNNKQLRSQMEISNKQGLSQLQQLYSYLTSSKVIVQDGYDSFEVRLPLL